MSWIRLRDFHLLTVGVYTYTSDRRFQTLYNEYSTDWTLQIKFPQLSDEGLYECQVSSDPPASHHVFLKVLGKEKIKIFITYVFFMDNKKNRYKEKI